MINSYWVLTKLVGGVRCAVWLICVSDNTSDYNNFSKWFSQKTKKNLKFRSFSCLQWVGFISWYFLHSKLLSLFVFLMKLWCWIYNFPILLDMRQEHDAHRYGVCTFIYRNPPITRLLKHECGCLGCILVQFDMHRRVSFLLPDFGLEPKKGE